MFKPIAKQDREAMMEKSCMSSDAGSVMSPSPQNKADPLYFLVYFKGLQTQGE